MPLAVTVGSMSGCDNGAGHNPITLSAATLGNQELQSTAEYLAREPYVGADIENGEKLAMRCRECHSLEAGGRHRIGPNLSGVFGRRAGKAPEFDYSSALADAEFHWTPRALDAWLASPYDFLPGNRMNFAGIDDAADRADLVAYLLTETGAEK